MRVIIPDDYQDAVRGLACFSKLAGHDVTIFNDTVRDLDALAERLEPADALVLIRERTPIREELLARLPRLKLISQTGKGTAHIDLAACARRGITVATGTGSPYAPAELTWALVLAALRHIPQEAARLRAGHWQSTLGTGLRGRTLGIWGPGLFPARRPARLRGGRRLRRRADPRRRPSAACAGERGVHAASRVCREGQLRELLWTGV